MKYLDLVLIIWLANFPSIRKGGNKWAVIEAMMFLVKR
jgi:hypothetical protein